MLKDASFIPKKSSIFILTKPRDVKSCTTLVEAAKVQQYKPILELAVEDYDEKLLYHRSCRSTFTHKKTINLLKHPSKKRQANEPRYSTRSRDAPSISSQEIEKKCIFCAKKGKYISIV